jgi:hypothetical protein
LHPYTARKVQACSKAELFRFHGTGVLKLFCYLLATFPKQKAMLQVKMQDAKARTTFISRGLPQSIAVNDDER